MLIIRLLALIAIWCSPSLAFAQAHLPEDKTAARVLVYFMVGQDDIPEANITLSQFKAQLETLKAGNYHVASLPEITQAYETGASLPEKTVALTFDGGDKSVIDAAAPILEAYKFPFTVFIAPERADADDPRYLNWKDLKKLHKTGLVTIGLHSQNYSSITHDSVETIRLSLNNATARLRDKMGLDADFFAYPFGEFSQNYKDVAASYNFKGAFGQQSGVMYQGSDNLALPRFTMTEDYADLDRFEMIVNSLPLPVLETTPSSSIVATQNPAIGFTTAQSMTDPLDHLSCFVLGQDKPKLSILGHRVELRLAAPVGNDRFRVNCTLTVPQESTEETMRWRWLGFLLHVYEPQ